MPYFSLDSPQGLAEFPKQSRHLGNIIWLNNLTKLLMHEEVTLLFHFMMGEKAKTQRTDIVERSVTDI